ncbi:MAG: hypothetical protein KAQ90_00690 [Melioribacteraceae bacterium]|nr:hypothetical protein [Melioribacteraceae bacterium]
MLQKKVTIILISLTFLALTTIFLWFFFINIYEIKLTSSAAELSLNDLRIIEIQIIPLNSFGDKAWFRTVNGNFKIEKGIELIETLTSLEDTDKIKFKTKNKAGQVVISASSSYGLFITQLSVELK